MKVISRWLLFWLLTCSLLAISLPGYSLGPEQAESFQKELYNIADMKPRYVWGGAEDPKKGLDCSGLMYLAAKRAGIMGVKRTTAKRMAEGKDGWNHMPVPKVEDVDKSDVVWWTFTSDRKFGHVGAVVVGRKSGLWECCHASSKAQSVVVVPFKGSLIRDIDRIGRLK